MLVHSDCISGTLRIPLALIRVIMLIYVVIKGALTFWTAAFPGLTRDLPEVQASSKEAIEESKS